MTSVTPVKICCSYKCAITQPQCSVAQGKIHSPLFSAALQIRLTAGVCHWKYTNEDLLFVQVSIDPTPMHCNTAFCKMHAPLFSAAVQNRLTAGLCDCKYTYEGLLFMQVCTDPAPMHCNTGQGKMLAPLLSAALQNRLTAGIVLLQLHLRRFAAHTSVPSPNPAALQHCSGQTTFPNVQCCSAK